MLWLAKSAAEFRKALSNPMQYDMVLSFDMQSRLVYSHAVNHAFVAYEIYVYSMVATLRHSGSPSPFHCSAIITRM
jgi:hypothetical protein